MSFLDTISNTLGTDSSSGFGAQVLGINASAIPGVGQYLGAQQTNNANAAINSANNAFNADQAQINRDFQASQTTQQENFQANQAATAMQTRVADLKAAGLNPAQAYANGGSGATAMSGASANGSSAQASGQIPMQNPLVGGGLSNLLSSAAQVSQILKTNADTQNVAQDTQNKADSNPLIHQQLVNIINDNSKTDAEKKLLSAQVISESSRPANISKDTALKSSEIGKNVSQITGQNTTNSLLNNELPASANKADVQSSWWGKLFHWSDPAVNSAAALKGTFMLR